MLIIMKIWEVLLLAYNIQISYKKLHVLKTNAANLKAFRV